MNCGNISAGVPVFALMKNMVPDVKDSLNTIRVYSTNTKKMMYLTVDVLNGEARVDGDCVMDGVPGTGSKILVDFREQGGSLTGKLFPSGNLVDTIKMDDRTTIDVTITDMVNPCVFFKAADFGLGLTGLELPNPDWSLKGPPGAQDRLAELRLKGSHLMGWTKMTDEQSINSTMPFAVSIATPDRQRPATSGAPAPGAEPAGNRAAGPERTHRIGDAEDAHQDEDEEKTSAEIPE